MNAPATFSPAQQVPFSELVEKSSNLVELAYSDPLTGIANRRRLEDSVAALIEERKDDPAPFTIGIMDLDGFKPINDIFGHGAGDAILKQLATRLKTCLPKGSLCARLGGDEFAFLLPFVFSENNAKSVGEALREVVSAPYELQDRSVRLSGSFGFAILPFGGENFAEIMSSADTALYHSKNSGRNQVTVFTHSIARQMKYAAQVEQALRQAIMRDQVRPHYQPIVDLKTGEILGFEALARWHDPELGWIDPDEFVLLAAERGIISQLSDSLLRQAATAFRNWPDKYYLSFNLSTIQLTDPDAANNILQIITKAGLPPHCLELEIRGVNEDEGQKQNFRNLNQLRNAGVKIVLDEFGSAHSTMNLLREFNFDKIKISRTIVSSIPEGRASTYITKAIISLCEGLDMQANAVGIENEQQRLKLLELGCNSGQGKLFASAMDGAQLRQYLIDHA